MNLIARFDIEHSLQAERHLSAPARRQESGWNGNRIHELLYGDGWQSFLRHLWREFYYSRYPESEWETEISKMRQSGINVVATYIFWNHHEEIEGGFEWQGNRDLRRFIQFCDRQRLYVILRTAGMWFSGQITEEPISSGVFNLSQVATISLLTATAARRLEYMVRLLQMVGTWCNGQIMVRSTSNGVLFR